MSWGKYKKVPNVPIEKEVKKIYKDDNESAVTLSYKIKFIDSARFVANSLSNLVQNLTEGIQRTKCKYCDCPFENDSAKENSIKYKCLSSNKSHSNKIDEELKKRVKDKFKFSDKDINKFILLLRKRVYTYESMDDWEDFNKRSLLEKD